MALLNFKGKSSIWNHHLSVPYQTLEKDKKLSLKGKNEDENLIIEADNLVALKSLLPKYQDKIKCVYIDPPYNTGNEGWAYNDNVNSPLIKDWIGQTIYTDDLTRHDKWLCMMTPRLKLLRELLSDDGVIFISIDDNEVHHLRSLMNEIFGEENYLQEIIWKRHAGGGNDSKHFAVDTEYILCYGKEVKNIPKLRIPLTPEDVAEYKYKDKHFKTLGPYKLKGFKRMRPDDPRVGLQYQITCPDGTKINDEWKWEESRFQASFKEDKVQIRKGRNDQWYVEYKIYLNDKNNEEREKVARSLISNDIASNSQGKSELTEILGKPDIFNNPKPSSLIKYLLSFVSKEKNDIILDSFAGSGTTAQAVMQLNQEGDGNRKFILVQLPEEIKKDTSAYKAGYRFVHEITRERVKRAIDKEKLGVGFTYMKLGPKIDAESILAGQLPSYKELAKYIYFLATGKTMGDDVKISEEDYFVGKIASQSIYLLYKKDFDKLKNMAVTLEWAEKINKKDKNKKIVYAPACFLDDENLEKFNIQFVGIPYSLFGKK